MRCFLFCVFTIVVFQAAAQTATSKDTFTKSKTAIKYPHAPYDLNEYISTNTHYPRNARRGKKAGKVIIKFVVEESGKISNCSIEDGFDEDCDAEALRVVASMPPWIPGEMDGKKIKVYYKVPVSFLLK